MTNLLCVRCHEPFALVIERNEHQLDCSGTPASKVKKANPGKKLEDLVTRSAKLLRSEGLKLKHYSPPRTSTGFVYAKAPLDFTGDLLGRAVEFDTKSCGSSSLPISDLRKREHQIELLKQSHQRGAIAFYLVEMREAGRYFAMPWPVLEPYMLATSRQSIPIDVLATRCPEVAKVGRLLDLVGAINAVGGVR